jgi:peptidoglycan-associated lipoprotein
MLDRRVPFALLLALGAILLSGCPDKKVKSTACDSDKDCTDGLRCVNKTCVQCGEDSHCPEGQECVNGGCYVSATECLSDAQCGDGQVCKEGRCKPCESHGECGPGGTCQAGVCERPKACTADDDCADDEDCIEGLCLSPWKSGADQATCPFETVYFEFDKAVVPPQHRDALGKIAECLSTVTGRGVLLHGHADENGTEEYNIALSERRGLAVADYLARLGVDPARLHIVPKGESEPTGRGAEADRRVEFQWQ